MEEGHGRHRGRGMTAWTVRCSGVGRCTGVGVEEEERGAGNSGAGGGGAHRRGVVLRRRGGRGWRGVEMNWDNFNPRHFYSSSSSLSVLLVN